MPKSLTLILLLLFCIAPSFAQEEILPFAYVINSNEVEQNLFIINALNAEILYSFDSDEYACPISLSADEQLFVYSRELTNNYAIDLVTSDIQVLEPGILATVVWNPRYNMMAFQYLENPGNRIIVFGTSQEEEFLNINLPFPYFTTGTTSRFVEIDLVAVAIASQTNEFTIYRGNRNQGTQETYEIEGIQAWHGLEISPDGNFLVAYSEGTIYTLDLRTGETYEHGQAETFARLIWLPNEDATLGYFHQTEAGEFILEPIAPDENHELEVQNYFISLSPEGNHLLYKQNFSEETRSEELWLMNPENSETYQIGDVSQFLSYVQWLSDYQFVYRVTNPDSENLNSTDLYFYDIQSGEKRQLTDTPDLEERFDCFRG